MPCRCRRTTLPVSQLFPFLICLFLNMVDFALLQMVKSSLFQQVFPYRQPARFMIDRPADSILHLVEGKDICLNGKNGYFWRKIRGHTPSRWAGTQEMNKLRSADPFGFDNLLLKILWETDGGRRRVGIVMRRHDLHDILLPPRISFRCRPCPGERRSRGAHLNSGVHIAFVVEAYIDDIIVIFRHTGRGLRPDAKGSPTPCE